MIEYQPPKWATRLLHWFCDELLLEEIEGDLYEAYQYRAKREGPGRAGWKYTLDVLRFFRPYAFEKYSRSKQFIPMFKNYYKIAIRNILKRKSFTAINLTGLTLSLSVVLLVGLFLQYHLTFDDHYPDSDRIYRIGNNYRSQSYTCYPFDGYYRADRKTELRFYDLLKSLPEVRQAVYLMPSNTAPSRLGDCFLEMPGKRIEEEQILFTNTPADFLEVFPQEQLTGSFTDFRNKINSVLLTRSVAEKLFGWDWRKQEVVGQSFSILEDQYTIAGVVEDGPANSHFQYNLIINVEDLDGWGAYTYFKTKNPIDREAFIAKLNPQLDQVEPGYSEDPRQRPPYIQNIEEIHTSQRDILYEMKARISPTVLRIFGAVALVILIITWVNYMNLSIAMYTQRQREIGMRKVMGARAMDISFQLMTEIVLIALLAFPIAWTLVYTVLPTFSGLMDISLSREKLYQPGILLLAVGLTVFTGIVSGIYPAIVFSRKKLTRLFSDRLSQTQGKYGRSVRRALLGLQFLLLVAMVSITVYIYQQMQYVQQKELGYNSEGVVSIPADGAEKHQRLKTKLLAMPGVEHVGSGALPGANMFNQTTYRLEGEEEVYDDAHILDIDLGLMRALAIEHPAFERLEAGMDSVQLINQTFADKLERLYGYSPSELIGKNVISEPEYVDEESGQVGFPYGIHGVLPDIHFFSLKHRLNPLIFEIRKDREYAGNTVVKFTDGVNFHLALGKVKDAYETVESEIPFAYTFLDERIEKLYRSERRSLWLISVLSLVAIVLAVMGLVGLVSFLVHTRQKEISIRKVFGASVGQILLLINREFVWLMIAATMLAVPLVYLIMNNWLDNFAYRIPINPVWIILAGMLSLLIVMAVVSLQSRRTARTSPAETLAAE